MPKISETIFAVLDTETTGPVPGEDVAIEIAVADVVDLCACKPQSWFVDPARPIPPSASAVHHLVDADVKGAPSLHELWEDISVFFEGRVLVAHNAPFDRSILSPRLDSSPWLDTLRMSRQLWEKGQPNAAGFPLMSHTQQELRYWLGLSVDTMGLSAHRAAADILVTASLLRAGVRYYLECGGEDELGAFMSFCERPVALSRMPLRGKNFGKPLPDIDASYLEWILKRGGETGKIDPDLKASIERELNTRMAANVVSSRARAF